MAKKKILDPSLILVEELEISQKAKGILLKNNFLSVADICSKSKSELMSIKGFGATCLAEVLIALKVRKLKLRKPDPKPKSDTKLEKFIIGRFLKPEIMGSIDWGREINAARALLKRYPKIEFWEKYALKFKLNSMLFFLGKGKFDLEKAYHSDKIKGAEIKSSNEVKHEKINSTVVGENIVEKPKTLKDFLNQF